MATVNVYLDLDRTLFATAHAAATIWGQLEQLYGVDAHKERERQADYYVHDASGSYYYDLAAHITACGLDPDEAAERLRASPIADNRLLVPGAVELVNQLIATGNSPTILTYGDAYYQQLKVALCPALSGITVHTTLGSKAAFLADKGECVLVDDKNIANELPENVRFIWVQLEGEQKSVKAPGAVTSLSLVKDELERLMH